MEIMNRSVSHSLGLWNDQEYHYKRYNIEACVEAECPSWPKTIQKRRERQGQSTANRVIDADGEGGANLSMRQWKCFGEIDRRQWSDA
jgi:hypothetical protein